MAGLVHLLRAVAAASLGVALLAAWLLGCGDGSGTELRDPAVVGGGGAGGTGGDGGDSEPCLGQPPSCTLQATPAVVALDQDLTVVRQASCTDSCSWYLDDPITEQPLPSDQGCDGEAVFQPGDLGLGLGEHTAVLNVSGPGGAGSCAASFTLA